LNRCRRGPYFQAKLPLLLKKDCSHGEISARIDVLFHGDVFMVSPIVSLFGHAGARKRCFLDLRGVFYVDQNFSQRS
jgi:hypothetical protein